MKTTITKLAKFALILLIGSCMPSTNGIKIGDNIDNLDYQEDQEITPIIEPPTESNPSEALADDSSIILLHHSTGGRIWSGGVSAAISSYNSTENKNYSIVERSYPASSPYGWNNYPYDYWNIWVNHAGSAQYLNEDTLEILTNNYNVIVFKHCYPVSDLLENTDSALVSSSRKSLENYKLQYIAIKNKMLSFPNNRFIVWTGAARVEAATTSDRALRMREFVAWVKNEWDEEGDNIFIWDFYELETEGGLYVRPEYAASSSDSHPNSTLSNMSGPLLSNRIISIIEGRGDIDSLTGSDD